MLYTLRYNAKVVCRNYCLRYGILKVKGIFILRSNIARAWSPLGKLTVHSRFTFSSPSSRIITVFYGVIFGMAFGKYYGIWRK